MTLAEIIERLEKATGPDRELDAGLLGVFDPSLEVRGLTVWRGNLCCGSIAKCLPHYTASLDAALALVERVLPGWSWSVRRSGFGNPADAELWNPRKAASATNVVKATSEAGSPALALCLALCRALQAQETRVAGQADGGGDV